MTRRRSRKFIAVHLALSLECLNGLFEFLRERDHVPPFKTPWWTYNGGNETCDAKYL